MVTAAHLGGADRLRRVQLALHMISSGKCTSLMVACCTNSSAVIHQANNWPLVITVAWAAILAACARPLSNLRIST